MGLFSSSSKSKSYLEVPEWMRGDPNAVQDAGMALLDPSMTPEERIAGLSDAERQAITQAIAMGMDPTQMNNLNQYGGDLLSSGFDWMSQAINMGPAMNMGPDMNMVAGIADNPYMDSMIQAATRGDYRNLTENQLTGSAMAQAMSGNTGSTRGAIGDAVLQRGYEDRYADVSSSMRGAAYNTGLGIASGVSAQNAGLQSQYQNLMANTGMNAMSGGANMYQMAQNLGLNNLQMLYQAGGLERGIDQQRRDFEYMDPFYRTGFVSDLTNASAQTYGTQRSKTTNSPSMVGMGLQAAGTFMSMPGFGGGGGGGGPGYDPSGMNPYSFSNFSMLPRV